MPRGRQRYGPELRNTYSFSTDPRLIDVLEQCRAHRFPDLSRSAMIGLAVREWLERKGFPAPDPHPPNRAARNAASRPVTPRHAEP